MILKKGMCQGVFCFVLFLFLVLTALFNFVMRSTEISQTCGIFQFSILLQCSLGEVHHFDENLT